MTVLVTGANGQLGCELRRLASNLLDIEWIFSDVVECGEVELLRELTSNVDTSTLKLDICNEDAVNELVAARAVNVIVNCAAYNNVEKAEEDEAAAMRLNVEAPAILARAMKQVGGLLISFSSDYVFAGNQQGRAYIESNEPNPLSTYGRSKWLGEKAIEDVGGRAVVIRTAWLYSEFGKNFVKTMLKLTSTKPEISVVADQVGSPTYALDLAELTIKVMMSEPQGFSLYHFSGGGECSWYEFAREIASIAGNRNCIVLPCTSKEFGAKVDRPAYSVLDKSLISKTFGMEIENWRSRLELCLRTMVGKV